MPYARRSYGRTRSSGQRRWGSRVRKQAKREIMKLAESKRAILFNEQYNYIAGLGAGDANYDTYISNAIMNISTGSADQQFTGNAIISPLVVLKGTVRLDWGPITLSTGNLPTYRVDVTLVAVNEQFSATTTARITSIAEDNTLYVRHPSANIRWMFNAQNVTVIKRKTMMFTPRMLPYAGTTVPTALELRPFKVAKRLKGNKEFETEFTAGGTATITPYLKGWNFYWVVSSACSNQVGTAITGANPLQITADRYMYFKDF